MKWSKVQLEPRFFEVDSYGIVNNMYYLSWCEIGRFQIAREAGLLVPRFNEEELLFMVTKCNLYYHKPVYFGSKVEIRSSIHNYSASRILFQHCIVDRITKTKFCDGQTEIVCAQRARMLLHMPSWIDQCIRHYLETVQR